MPFNIIYSNYIIELLNKEYVNKEELSKILVDNEYIKELEKIGIKFKFLESQHTVKRRILDLVRRGKIKNIKFKKEVLFKVSDLKIISKELESIYNHILNEKRFVYSSLTISLNIVNKLKENQLLNKNKDNTKIINQIKEILNIKEEFISQKELAMLLINEDNVKKINSIGISFIRRSITTIIKRIVILVNVNIIKCNQNRFKLFKSDDIYIIIDNLRILDDLLMDSINKGKRKLSLLSSKSNPKFLDILIKKAKDGDKESHKILNRDLKCKVYTKEELEEYQENLLKEKD